MRFPQMTPTVERVANKQRNDTLQRLRIQRLEEGGIKLRILTELSKIEQANMYKLWKRLHDVGHYSTVLRALIPLEQMKLVRVVPLTGRIKRVIPSRARVPLRGGRGRIILLKGRSERIYAITLLGELILALVKGGWRSAAQLLAERSPNFRECIRAHFFRDPYRYWSLTRDVIEEIVKIAWEYVVEDIDIASFVNVENIVRQREIEWVKEHIVEALNDPSSRPWISKYLKRMSHANWITSELLPFIDNHIEEEKAWLQVLDRFKSDLLSAEKREKLTQFFP